MKTSTIILVLLALNSGFLASYLSAFFGGISPLYLGISEGILLMGFYGFRVLRDVRNSFDVTISFSTLFFIAL